jgi:hypothetical protein
MNHRGIEFFVAKTMVPGVWQWQFQIGDKVRSGKTETPDRPPGDPARAAQDRPGAEGVGARAGVSGPGRPPASGYARGFSSEMDTGSREENASKLKGFARRHPPRTNPVEYRN